MSVVPFPRQETAAPSKPGQDQSGFFPPEGGYRGIFSSVDLTNYDQGRFFDLLAKTEAKCLVDVRNDPIFRYPQFLHDGVHRHFTERKIKYVFASDFLSIGSIQTRIALEPEAIEVHEQRRDLFKKIVSWGLFQGLTLLLHDRAEQSASYEFARAEILANAEFRAELPGRMIEQIA